MKIDDHIVQKYLSKEANVEYRDHWIFSCLEEGQHLFEEPSADRRGEIAGVLCRILAIAKDFKFLNHDLVQGIFGDTSMTLQQANLLLVVGCPEPYDAMVRKRDGADCIIFDLVRLVDYARQGHDLDEIVKNFLTHELIHVIINAQHPVQGLSYEDQLDYIAFHEGFAHLLSFADNIEAVCFGGYESRFVAAKHRLVAALNENEPQRQQDFLFEANAGKYWDKFGVIAAMLYLADNLGSLGAIYGQGWQGFAKKIVEEG